MSLGKSRRNEELMGCAGNTDTNGVFAKVGGGTPLE